MDILQEIYFDEESNTIKVSASFTIKSESEILESLNEEFGIKPTRLWNKDEEYLGRQFNPTTNKVEQIIKNRPFSIWEIESSGFISSKRVEEHVKYLVDLLVPKKELINRLLNERQYFIRVNIYKESCTEVIDYSIAPWLLGELMSFCNDVRFSNNYVPADNREEVKD